MLLRKQAGHIMSLVGSIAVHVNATFSLTNCLVSAADCDLGLTHSAEENTRKKLEPRKTENPDDGSGFWERTCSKFAS